MWKSKAKHQRRLKSINRLRRIEKLEDRRMLAAQFVPLGTFDGAIPTAAHHVSDDGSTVLVDPHRETGGQEIDDRSFVWTKQAGILTPLENLPGWSDTTAVAITGDGGAIVGSSHQDGILKAVRWDNGVISVINEVPPESNAWDVSDDGQTVVGNFKTGTLYNDGAYRLDGNAITYLEDLPDGPDDAWVSSLSADGAFMVGASRNDEWYEFDQAVRWSSNGRIEALGFAGHATDISADGTVITGRATVFEVTVKGKKERVTYRSEPFRWTESGGRELLGDLLPGDNDDEGVGSAISADGSIIAGYAKSANGLEAFIWNETDGMRSLAELLATDHDLPLPGWQLSRVSEMTPDGSALVGRGINPSGVTEAFVVYLGPPSAGISVTPTFGLETTEDGGSATFDVVLATQPTADVTISTASDNPDEGTTDVSSLTFTPANWDVPQTVTVTGVDDAVEDGNVGYAIVTGAAVSADMDYSGMNAVDVGVTNLDNEVPPAIPLYVSDISFESRRGRKDWRAVFEVRADTNGNGIADVGDNVAAGVAITVVFAEESFSGTTDSNGTFQTDWIRKIERVDQVAYVHDLALTGYAWNPLSLDLEDDSDEDGYPDDVLTF